MEKKFIMSGIVSDCFLNWKGNMVSMESLTLITGNSRRVKFICNRFGSDELLINHKVRILYRKEKGQKIIENIKILD